MKLRILSLALMSTAAFSPRAESSWHNIGPLRSNELTAYVDFQTSLTHTETGTPNCGPDSHRMTSPLWVNVLRPGLKATDHVRAIIINYAQLNDTHGAPYTIQLISEKNLSFAEPNRFTASFEPVTLYKVTNYCQSYESHTIDALRQEIVIWVNGQIYKNPENGQNLQFNFWDRVNRGGRDQSASCELANGGGCLETLRDSLKPRTAFARLNGTIV